MDIFSFSNVGPPPPDEREPDDEEPTAAAALHIMLIPTDLISSGPGPALSAQPERTTR